MRRVSCFERFGEMVRSYKRRRLLSGVGGRWTNVSMPREALSLIDTARTGGRPYYFLSILSGRHRINGALERSICDEHSPIDLTEER